MVRRCRVVDVEAAGPVCSSRVRWSRDGRRNCTQRSAMSRCTLPRRYYEACGRPAQQPAKLSAAVDAVYIARRLIN